MVRPYYLSLITVYAVLLPMVTYLFTNWTSHPENYTYAYWGVLIATILLPITCLINILHLGISIAFYLKQRNNPQSHYHIYFILGVIPVITIFCLVLSLIWQLVLKLELCFQFRYTPRDGIKLSCRLILFYFEYLIATLGGGLFLLVFLGTEYLLHILISFIKSAILYASVFFLYHILLSRNKMKYWMLAKEFIAFIITYLTGSIVCFIIYIWNPSISPSIKSALFIIGAGGATCILGSVIFYLSLLYSVFFSQGNCAKHSVEYFVFYMFFGIFINYGFTKAANNSIFDYGYILIVFLLILHIAPTCIVVVLVAIFNRPFYDRTYCTLFGFLPVFSVFMFSAFWVWTQGYNHKEGIYLHILYIFGLQYFSCFLSNLLSYWYLFPSAFVRSIYFDMRLNLSKKQSYITAIVYLFISWIIQCLVTLYLGHDQYLFGLAAGPILPLLTIFRFIVDKEKIYNTTYAYWRRGMLYISELFLAYYMSFTIIFSCFFIDFCIKQIYNPGDVFYVEYIFGILFWIPTFIGSFIYLSIKAPIIKLIICIISVLSMVLPISYIFTQASVDENADSLVLLIAGLFCLLPMTIYFLLCSIYPSDHSNPFCLFQGCKGMYSEIRHICRLKKWYSCILPILFFLYFLLLYIIFIIGLLLYSYIFQTFKLGLLPKLSSAHIPFPTNMHNYRRYINLNFAFFLEGIAHSLPQIILLSVHKWLYSSKESTTSLTFYWLSMSISSISFTHSVFNIIFNIHTNKRLLGFTEMPLICKLFLSKPKDLNSFVEINIINTIIKEIPTIGDRAPIPPRISKRMKMEELLRTDIMPPRGNF